MRINDGGPAFPVPMIPIDNAGGFTEVRFTGMSLRAYFAGQALAGILASSSCDYDAASKDAVFYADALIAELDRDVNQEGDQS